MRKVGNKDYRGKPRVQTKDFGPSKTIQSEKPDHVREILKRYGHTGIVEGLNQADAQYADLSTLGTFADVQRTVRAAEMDFMQLPSKAREAFGHKVENWLDASEHGLSKEQTDVLVRHGYMEAPETSGSGTDSVGDAGVPGDAGPGAGATDVS